MRRVRHQFVSSAMVVLQASPSVRSAEPPSQGRRVGRCHCWVAAAIRLHQIPDHSGTRTLLRDQRATPLVSPPTVIAIRPRFLQRFAALTALLVVGLLSSPLGAQAPSASVGGPSTPPSGSKRALTTSDYEKIEQPSADTSIFEVVAFRAVIGRVKGAMRWEEQTKLSARAVTRKHAQHGGAMEKVARLLRRRGQSPDFAGHRPHTRRILRVFHVAVDL